MCVYNCIRIFIIQIYSNYLFKVSVNQLRVVYVFIELWNREDKKKKKIHFLADRPFKSTRNLSTDHTNKQNSLTPVLKLMCGFRRFYSIFVDFFFFFFSSPEHYVWIVFHRGCFMGRMCDGGVRSDATAKDDKRRTKTRCWSRPLRDRASGESEDPRQLLEMFFR